MFYSLGDIWSITSSEKKQKWLDLERVEISDENERQFRSGQGDIEPLPALQNTNRASAWNKMFICIIISNIILCRIRFDGQLPIGYYKVNILLKKMEN